MPPGPVIRLRGSGLAAESSGLWHPFLMLLPFDRRALLPLGLLVVACSSSSTDGGVSAAERKAFSRATNLIPVDVSVGGASGLGIVDTGNPLVLLDPSTFGSVAGLPQNGGNVSSISLGSQTAKNVYVLPTNAGLTSPDPQLPLSANVGYAAIGSYVATFNYRDVTFGLGTVAPPPPAGLEPETVLDFAFEGGETLDGVQIPRSRIVVTVALEGTDYRMIVDTGASYLTVSGAAFTALTSDGRAQIDGGTAETTAGASTSSLARAKSVTVGGVAVDSVVVAYDSSFDTNLGAIGTDAGETIDGSLGGTYLHDFYVTIDYPAKKLHLARYSNTTFAIDPGHRIGVDLALSGSSYVVGATSGDAASKGIAIGDTLVSIDGVSLDGLSVSEAAALLFGSVGSTKSVKLASKTVAVAVEELLSTTAGATPVGTNFHDGILRRNFAAARASRWHAAR